MIDFNNITKADLLNLGINIQDQREFERFADFLLEELEVKIGERISEGLSDDQLDEFDSLHNRSKENEWLQTNEPNFRDIVREEHHRMVWYLLKNRKKVSDCVMSDPIILSKNITLLDLSKHSYECLFNANLLTLKDVIDFANLLNITGMDEEHKKEVIKKIVDYLV